MSSRTESVPWQQISLPSGPTLTPRSATANAWSACWSTTSPCIRPTAFTCTSGSRRADHSLVVAIPPKAWQVRQTHPDTLAALDRLLDTHTDAQTADALNAAGHRSGEGKLFTARIVLEARRSNNLPSHAERLRTNGLLTETEIAARLGVHESTVKSWTRAGILNSHKANDNNERLYDHQPRAIPTSPPDKAAPSENEFPPNPRQEVHYEAKPLSRASPADPTDGSTPSSMSR